MIPLLTAKVFNDAGFMHGFSTRAGGSFSASGSDSIELARLLEIPSVFQVTQVHGNVVVAARAELGHVGHVGREADALVAENGDAVAVRVADCVPVLLADRRTGRVVAVHAGWRGIVAGILPNALAQLGEDVIAAIGPCIGPCCFEVGRDVGERIGFVDRVTSGNAFVDLRAAVRAQLRGIVEDVPGCTRCEASEASGGADFDARFHSYRRDGKASGRQVGFIRAKQSDREAAHR